MGLLRVASGWPRRASATDRSPPPAFGDSLSDAAREHHTPAPDAVAVPSLRQGQEPLVGLPHPPGGGSRAVFPGVAERTTPRRLFLAILLDGRHAMRWRPLP